MKEITGKQKPKLNLLPPENKVDKSIIQNPQNVAKEFNKCFTSVGPKLQKNCQHWANILRLLTPYNEKCGFRN